MKYDLYACAPAAHSSQRMQINFLKETVFFFYYFTKINFFSKNMYLTCILILREF